MQTVAHTKSIFIKNARGTVQSITPFAFQKLFGVVYTGKLLFDSRCPPVDWSMEAPVLKKAPPPERKNFFQQQFAQIKGVEAWDGAQMKGWLYADCVRQEHVANVYIAKISDSVGHGAFALEDIAQGEMLGEYTGLARAHKNGDHANAYLFNYLKNAVIDASKRGNFSRFVNHSTFECNVRYMRILVDDILHVILVARRKIEKDEQILLDYGLDYWQNRTAPQDLGSCATPQQLLFTMHT